MRLAGLKKRFSPIPFYNSNVYIDLYDEYLSVSVDDYTEVEAQ